MAKKGNVAEFTLKVTDNKYKGETYTSLVGSFKKGRDSFLISIQTDAEGNPTFYTTKDGKSTFIYARAVSFQQDGEKPKRRNEMK